MLLSIILTILIIAVMVSLLPSYYKTFYSPHKRTSETVSPELNRRKPHNDTARERIKQLTELPCEFVTTRSYDGLILSARYYEGKNDGPLFICFHGYRGSALRDMAGFGMHLIEQGYRVMLVDERAHWRSGGHTITFGLRERRDVLSWLAYANDRFGTDTPVYLFGISMGGGTVLMASGDRLPDNVKGVIADCPFNSPKDIIKHVCRRLRLNPTLCWPIIWLAGIVYGHFNAGATTAADEVKKSTKPILIIHGEGDTFVPMSMSKQVEEANPDMVRWHSIPEAGHGMSYYFDTEDYLRSVNDFIKRTEGS